MVNPIFGQKSTLQKIKIEPYLALQNYEHFKRLVLLSTDGEVDYIDGFEFKWGYKYEIEVKTTKLNPPLTDGTTSKHSLVNIIQQSKVADTSKFELFLSPLKYYHQLDNKEEIMNQSFVQLNDSCFLYFDAVEIEVPKAWIQSFNIMIADKTNKSGTFNYINENRIRLIDLK